jgi:hypothetical protein
MIFTGLLGKGCAPTVPAKVNAAKVAHSQRCKEFFIKVPL